MTLKTFTLLVLIALSQAACGATIPREEVLECGLPDGSKFVLRAKYDWVPWAQFVRHVGERQNETDFSVSFHSKKFQHRIDFPLEFRRAQLKVDGNSEELCLNFRVVGNNAVIYQYIIFDGENKFTEIKTTNFKGLLLTISENPIPIQNELNSRGIEPLSGTSSFGYIGNHFVYEQGLATAGRQCNSRLGSEKPCPIVAVARSTSADNGSTWVGPVITADAKIFELGKTLQEQSFIARPISINGKSIETLRREEARDEAKEAKKKRAERALFQRQEEQYAHSLQSAIASGDLIQFEQRLNAGANINAPTDQDDRAPLLIALYKPETARFALALINRGAKLNPKGIPPGVNVLMLAAGYSTPEVMKALLAKQKFDVNQRNPSGGTALSYAVASGQIDNVRLLLELGADTQIKTSDGSLIDLARQQGHTEIVKLLEQRKR